MHSVAQGWLIYMLTHSPFWLGVVSALSALPVLFLSFVGGILADSYSHRKILLITQSGLALSALLMGILVSCHVIEIWHIAAIALFFGCINAVDMPVRQSFFANLAGDKKLMGALSCHSAMLNGTRVIGPLLAGFCMAFLGEAGCFYVNAVSFLPAMIVLLQRSFSSEKRVIKSPLSKGMTAIFSYLLEDRFVVQVLCGIACFSLFGISCFTLMPVIAAEQLQVGSVGFSILIASSGVGAFFAAMILHTKNIRNISVLPCIAIIFSLSLSGLAWSSFYICSVLFATIAGGTVTVFLTMSNCHLFEVVPKELRGRMIALSVCAFSGLVPFGNIAIGMLAHIIGTVSALHVFSGIHVMWCIFVIMHTPFLRTFGKPVRLFHQ
jgi:MFS family permease